MNPHFSFELQATDPVSGARAGRLSTPHGSIETPTFMPVGTRASVKALTRMQLLSLDAQILLSNAYHLFLRPGGELVAEAGGLHGFMSWPRPLLTDCGGFQIFSLKDTMRLDDEGVSFRSILDGSSHRWTPESNMKLQQQLGADILMQLDVCVSHRAELPEVELAMQRSAAWARRCRVSQDNPRQALFAIVQGGMHTSLRLENIARLQEIESSSSPFEGYALGGYSVGEPHEVMLESMAAITGALPPDRPRYLMGLGNPTSMLASINLGMDMFDSVLPTRTARLGTAFSSEGRLNLRNARFARDFSPLDPLCGCSTCQHHSRAYLRHLIQSREINAAVLLSEHNVHYLLDLTRKARAAILAGNYQDFLKDWYDSAASADY
ncbi:MAG: tRNA guanosine(34) transglycosylase Tgt [Coriobacteriales bacterium]|jgi:queuine tRNA-ribosyltransferase|nr:tRNA guanosine(34) transglycosylase Tgt [Coriobacteriales bacterium]